MVSGEGFSFLGNGDVVASPMWFANELLTKRSTTRNNKKVTVINTESVSPTLNKAYQKSWRHTGPISKCPNYLKISQLWYQNVQTISKFPNYLKISQLSQNVQTISKCPNYLKISQLTILKCPNFHQRVNLRAEPNFLG